MNTTNNPYRVFSFGGGVQSVAVLVLAAQGIVQYDAFVFANVGADSERPETLAYIEQYARPFADAHGIQFVETQRTMRGRGKVTLRQELERAKRSFIIPARLPNRMGFGNRNCTTDFKIRVIDNYVRSLDPRPERVVVGLGISTDEYQRARSLEWHDVESETAQHPRKLGFWKRREYPLLDLRKNRASCEQMIRDANLPVPPKSACYFCPFQTARGWAELKRTRPDLFADAVRVEQIINEKRVDVGRDGMYLHPYLRPLEEATSMTTEPMFEDDDACESGYCMV